MASTTVKDYYSSVHAGSIQLIDTTGNNISVQDIVNRTEKTQIVAQLESQYLANEKSLLIKNYLTAGYTQQADGSLYSGLRYGGAVHGREYITDSTTVVADYNATIFEIASYGSDPSNKIYSVNHKQSQSYNVYYDNYGYGISCGNLNINSDTIEFKTGSITVNDAVINAGGDYSAAFSDNVALSVKLTREPGYAGGYSENYVSGYLYADGSYGLTYSKDAKQVTIFTSNAVNGYYVTAVPVAVVSTSAPLINPDGTGFFPTVFAGSYGQQRSVFNLQTTNVENGSHTINTDYSPSNGVINIEGGVNIVNGYSGFVYTKSGDNTISHANTVFEGSSNDIVNYAKIIYTGSGNNVINDADTIYAGTGTNTIGEVDKAYYGGASSDIINYSYANIYGSSGNLTVLNNYGSTVVGGSGNDLVIGSSSDFIAGSGNDTLFGNDVGTNFIIDPSQIGHDVIGAVVQDDYQIISDFYQKQGIADWRFRYTYADLYYDRANIGSGGYFYTSQYIANNLQNSFYYGGPTFQQAIDQGLLKYIAPLPVLIKTSGYLQPSSYYDTAASLTEFIGATDYRLLSQLYKQGLYSPASKIVFKEGLAPSDLHFSLGHLTTSLTGVATDPQTAYLTLNLEWSGGHSIRVLMPSTTDIVGSGVQEFDFSDGTVLTLADMMDLLAAQGPVTMHLERGDGQIAFSVEANFSLQIGTGIAPSEISYSRTGTDLVITDGVDTWQLTGWYADPTHSTTLMYFISRCP